MQRWNGQLQSTQHRSSFQFLLCKGCYGLSPGFLSFWLGLWLSQRDLGYTKSLQYIKLICMAVRSGGLQLDSFGSFLIASRLFLIAFAFQQSGVILIDWSLDECASVRQFMERGIIALMLLVDYAHAPHRTYYLLNYNIPQPNPKTPPTHASLLYLRSPSFALSFTAFAP